MPSTSPSGALRWELNEDAVHLVVALQIFHNREQIEGAYRGGRRQQRTRHAEVLASGNFALYVDLRSGIFTDKHRREARPHPCRREQPHFVLQFREHLVANLVPVEDPCAHSPLAFDLLVWSEIKS